MIKNIIFILLPLVLIFSSCGEKHVHYSEKIFENFKWAHSEKFISSVNIESTEKQYDIAFQIKHNQSYPFENIYLRISDDFNGTEFTDTVNINLSNNYGNWKGDKSGNTFELNTILRKSHKFPKKGNYNIIIEQFTRADSLSGVSSVRFLVDEVKVR